MIFHPEIGLEDERHTKELEERDQEKKAKRKLSDRVKSLPPRVTRYCGSIKLGINTITRNIKPK